MRCLKYISWLIIFLALLFAFIFRLYTIFTYIQFDADQARDGYVYMHFWDKSLPWAERLIAYGPSSSVSSEDKGYFLPPLYYYLVLPFTAFSANPIWQAFCNALLSFLSVPLLIFLLYQLLASISTYRRLFLAALGGLWWSVFYLDILYSNEEWNPSSIPFFLFSFLLLSNLIWKKVKYPIIIWLLMGLNLAILVSLHSTALFIIPIVYLVLAVYFIIKTKKWWLPLSGLIGSQLFLLPYWLKEYTVNFTNTRIIIRTLMSNGGEKITGLEKIMSIFSSYFNLSFEGYFFQPKIYFFGGIFLALIIVPAIYYFRGNKKIFFTLLLTELLFFLAIFNFSGEIFKHYKILLWPLPLFLTIFAIAYFPAHKWYQKIIISFFCLGIIISIISNCLLLRIYWQDHYGEKRSVNTQDIFMALEKIPDHNNFCLPRKYKKSFEYFNNYIIKKQINFYELNSETTESVCAKDAYWFVVRQQASENIIFSLLHY